MPLLNINSDTCFLHNGLPVILHFAHCIRHAFTFATAQGPSPLTFGNI